MLHKMCGWLSPHYKFLEYFTIIIIFHEPQRSSFDNKTVRSRAVGLGGIRRELYGGPEMSLQCTDRAEN